MANLITIILAIAIALVLLVSIAIRLKLHERLLRRLRRGQLPRPVITSAADRVKVHCPVADSEIPIESISFRCSGEHLGADSPAACANYLQAMTFEEVRKGYRETGEGNNVVHTPLLKYMLDLPPAKLRAKNRDYVLNILKRARCSITNHPVVPYCNCQGADREHRIDFDYTVSDLIALTGPVAVGKTVYLHMLERYLNQLYNVGYKINVKLDPFETRSMVRDNLRKMYKERILPRPTAMGEKFEYRFTVGPSWSGWPDRPIKLFINDTSGEIPERMDLVKKHFGFFAFSDSLVLFLDPYSIPELARECLRPDSQTDDQQDPFFIQSILENLIEFLGFRAYNSDKKYPVNLAVAITKCDEYMHKFDEELKAELKNVHHLGAQKPNFEPLDRISASFKQLLSQFDSPHSTVASFINKAEHSFAKVGFFPISSLGTGVVKEKVEITSMAHTGSGFISAGQSLDDAAANASNWETSPSNQPQTLEKTTTFINKYEGNLDPLYLDYPILWLQKHRRRK